MDPAASVFVQRRASRGMKATLGATQYKYSSGDKKKFSEIIWIFQEYLVPHNTNTAVGIRNTFQKVFGFIKNI